MRELTYTIRRAAARWLFYERAAYAVAEDFNLPGWRPDVIAVIPLRSEPRLRDSFRGVGMSTDKHWGLDWNGLGPRRAQRIVVVEVKTTRRDLAAGVQRGQVANRGGLAAFADEAYVAIPSGSFEVDGLLPSRWGLLHYLGDRSTLDVRVVVPATRLVPRRTKIRYRLTEYLAEAAMWRLYGRFYDAYHADRLSGTAPTVGLSAWSASEDEQLRLG